MNAEQLRLVLEKHGKWLRGEEGGERASLNDANLSGAYLIDANLSGANLRNADLGGADLSGANLSGANLSGANLRGANLSYASLNSANLRGANLRNADLGGAYLIDAYLSGAYLRNADLTETKLPHFLLSPETGAFEAWKKLQGGVIANLLIPADAKRVNAISARKCRAERVEVLELFKDGVSVLESAHGLHQSDLVYAVGLTIEADSFNDDIRQVCTHGIHYFMTRREAEEYQG